MRHTHVVIINVCSRLRAKDANRIGIEGRSAIAIGNWVLHFNGPFLRLGLTSRPGFAADMGFFTRGIHSQLQGIPRIRLPGPGNGLIHPGTRRRFPGDNSQLLLIAVQQKPCRFSIQEGTGARCFWQTRSTYCLLLFRISSVFAHSPFWFAFVFFLFRLRCTA